MTTDVDVLNAAMVLTGQPPVESRDDPEAVAAWAAYDSVIRRVLGTYPWTFLRCTRKLARDATPVSERWLYSFQVPPDISGEPRAVYDSAETRTPFAGWERHGDKILSDAPDLWLRYPRRTCGPDEWSAGAAMVIETALRGELAMAIREDTKLRAELLSMAFGTPQEGGRGGLFAQARTLDAQGEPSTTIAMGSNPLIEARTGITTSSSDIRG